MLIYNIEQCGWVSFNGNGVSLYKEQATVFSLEKAIKFISDVNDSCCTCDVPKCVLVPMI